MKTQAEINELKKQWTADPIWDIEKTEGFGAHEEELADYRKKMDERWKAHHAAEVAKKAVAIGCPDNGDCPLLDSHTTASVTSPSCGETISLPCCLQSSEWVEV